ncbi:MAG: beta-1,6-N-acetylglucosaminyltransferase [Paracoccaceae bacterium]|jgi:hypothetical protein|nr:beta-1,6-N-acetylglucosaminyltransferase [Paracoccaceae bacterium]MDP7186240.1 beta-1,6-N-acetylglucosaminyltransferase [Paracoccaceae bacterium]
MSFGVVMLVHTALGRTAQVARHWAENGCPVVIHADTNVTRDAFDGLRKTLADLDNVSFSKRFRCEWGTWGLVAATQAASEQILQEHPGIRHVYLASGSCLPLRPVDELREYLAARPQVDFIESATTHDVPWTVGGLDIERFTLRFPFSWKSQRKLFDGYVRLQRRLRFKRRIPKGLVPHMGSQWWCLTRQTLSAILEDPDREIYDRYFRRVWIPDESYFQTMVRQYSLHIESRSLTLSKFDYQGKPHIFYDDHLQLLRRSDCFVARKIWPYADRLYNTFLNAPQSNAQRMDPSPDKIDRIFAKAVERRTRGRDGLIMQSRYPKEGFENSLTAARYSVFEGFTELFEDFEPWLTRMTNAQVHGHLFAQDRAEFADRQSIVEGCLSDSANLRDHRPHSFLNNLIWNTRGVRQCFQFGPNDNQEITWHISKDVNAQISVISGAWAIPLYKQNRNFAEIRDEAARLQKIENDHIQVLRSTWSKARVRVWTLAEFVEAPIEPLQMIVDEIGHREAHRLTELPRMVDLTGFGQFLQNLKNQGMHPYLMGEFTVAAGDIQSKPSPRKPYLVR